MQPVRQGRITEYAVIGFVFVCLLVLLSALIAESATPTPVWAMVKNAGRTIILRFPKPLGGAWEEIIVTERSEGSAFIMRYRVETGQPSGPPVQLSDAQWQEWQTLRIDWCQQPPPDGSTQQPAFELALNCPMAINTWDNVRFVRIPATQFPTRLRHLVVTVPSSSCKDSLCGW